ncbi:hypothetical protein IBTHAUMO2_150003 [Nitrosopumilaceae archaeon]|nr:hypothetical protein IBTHAUMO2_150003 [Nitrosopumilaceae archaeon]
MAGSPDAPAGGTLIPARFLGFWDCGVWGVVRPAAETGRVITAAPGSRPMWGAAPVGYGAGRRPPAAGPC